MFKEKIHGKLLTIAGCQLKMQTIGLLVLLVLLVLLLNTTTLVYLNIMLLAPGFGGTSLAGQDNPNNGTLDDGNAGIIGKASLAGKFILPTTHQPSVDVATSKYKKGNTAYVMVRAKFAPKVYADSFSGNADGTFFYGVSNGKFYTSYLNALNPEKKGVAGQKVAKYVGGKVLYYAWVNPDNVNQKKWLNSPVIRNNIYHIHITGFASLGTNWNPLFPEDPDKGNSE